MSVLVDSFQFNVQRTGHDYSKDFNATKPQTNGSDQVQLLPNLVRHLVDAALKEKGGLEFYWKLYLFINPPCMGCYSDDLFFRIALSN